MMSQILLKEINKYNNSFGYFSRGKRMAYSSKEIYIGEGEKKKPIVLKFDECRGFTSLYGCVEKMKIIYLNILMQTIETGVPFTFVNNLFDPDELEELISFKVSNIHYPYPIYNVEKEDIGQSDVTIISREASIIVHFHNYTDQESKDLQSEYGNSLFKSYVQNNSVQTSMFKEKHGVLIIASDSADTSVHPALAAQSRGLGIYIFCSNNELSHVKLANTMTAILLNNNNNDSLNYKKIIDIFTIKNSTTFNHLITLKENLQIKEHIDMIAKSNINYKDDYVFRSFGNNDTVNQDKFHKLKEIKKFY